MLSTITASLEVPLQAKCGPLAIFHSLIGNTQASPSLELMEILGQDNTYLGFGMYDQGCPAKIVADGEQNKLNLLHTGSSIATLESKVESTVITSSYLKAVYGLMIALVVVLGVGCFVWSAWRKWQRLPRPQEVTQQEEPRQELQPPPQFAAYAPPSQGPVRLNPRGSMRPPGV
eukprot:Blabericola_migrator_1__7554@NODE_385_length_9127_cov_126_586424_g308_i0_p5_GENE_NODE_385_length_9127_cov_126_586424_g308_i0NODE_385_length_9127_cov_126_586424_g308_i0_p5_ORF_typecomplete_len174_score35_54PAP_PilO/PF06864_12/0_0014Comm/PF15957_5/0_0035DUF2207/PF09972_9/0_01DUF3318/PF11780_8/0_025SIT/PF15330_6/0_029GntP_permease/PF02447_16/0_092EVC2_like/PF12297_8/0_16TMEM154/PF15102_6/0_18HemX/PF04375_14/0_2Vma12/PF11712_8/0_22DUF2613/PF11021_8/0_48_NODE_385_length_9127_cov_126_586424_g308_i0806